MAEKIDNNAPLKCTAGLSSTPCSDISSDCQNCRTGEKIQDAKQQEQLEPDQPKQLLTPSIAIPLPPPPSLVTCSPLEMPPVPPNTVESESQTDSLDEGIDTNDCCNNMACDQVAHDNGVPESNPSVSCDKYASNEQCYDNKQKLQVMCHPISSIIPRMNSEDQQLDDMTVSPEFINEAEVSYVEIHDKLIDRDALEAAADSSESEEDDQLKPLMVDNHQECYLAKRQIQQIIQQNSILMKELNSSTESDGPRSDRSYSQQLCNRQTPYLAESACESPDLQSSDDATSKDHRSNSVGQLHDGEKEIDSLSPDEIPDDQMAEEITEQVEFYFSNDNILKDAFLLKHVRRNKEGFVSLKLVSSFKRVRQLTKDWRVVGHALRRKSRKIELNELGTKIRRIEPLPTFDETMPSRTIVACDLPVDKLCIEKVSDIFSKCGEIALIRILRPGAGIPVDVRQFMNKYPELQAKDCALVEFVESQSARNAKDLEGPFKVFEMVAPKKKTGKKAITVTKLIENYKYNDNNYERNRGGIMIPQPQTIENDLKFKLRRNNSDFYVKPEHAHICTQRKYSYNPNNANNNMGHATGNMYNHPHGVEQPAFIHYPRRASNFSIASSESMSRKYSSCSEGYSSCSDYSRRPSGASSSGDSRRGSNCSDYCPCSRRGSQCSTNIVGSPNMTLYNNDLLLRRMSSLSSSSQQHGGVPIGPEYNNVRHHSHGSIVPHYDRSFSHPQDMGRRISTDINGGGSDRKLSTGSNGSGDRAIIHDSCRKFSNGFDPNRKLSNSDQYFNGRRLSSDSGYDRRMSFGSDYGSSPRSRSGSFLTCQHKNSETVVRTPIGPDGSKGFASRARKVGQIVSPV